MHTLQHDRQVNSASVASGALTRYRPMQSYSFDWAKVSQRPMHTASASDATKQALSCVNFIPCANVLSLPSSTTYVRELAFHKLVFQGMLAPTRS